MKRLTPLSWIVIGCLLFWVLILGVYAVSGATKTLTFGWQQASADLPNLQMWRIYSSVTPGAGYTLMSQVVYDGAAKPEYTGTATITQADNTARTYYFICRSVGKNGNESGNSNEVSAAIDLTAPSTPIQFRVTIGN